ncbi:MAG: hypothetical protein F4062_04895 [Acidimicrobiia bacterium]|nr:hypothetical protein [Acidimicrobiia bacterium]
MRLSSHRVPLRAAVARPPPRPGRWGQAGAPHRRSDWSALRLPCGGRAGGERRGPAPRTRRRPVPAGGSGRRRCSLRPIRVPSRPKARSRERYPIRLCRRRDLDLERGRFHGVRRVSARPATVAGPAAPRDVADATGHDTDGGFPVHGARFGLGAVRCAHRRGIVRRRLVGVVDVRPAGSAGGRKPLIPAAG